jgi:hypothetical protein
VKTVLSISGGPAAIVMIILGYRATIAIGAGLLMLTFIILSYLEGNEGLIKFLMYGPVGK